MYLIKKEDFKRETFKDNELHQFVINAFKDGMVPQDFAKFESCFNHETTDGSLCFSYKFGQGKDDWAMLFFYPTHCAVPIPYQKHLRNQEYCKMNLLITEYQLMLAKKIKNSNYMLQLAQDSMFSYGVGLDSLQQRVNKIDEDDDFEDREQIIQKRKQSIAKYTKKFNELISYIENKLDNSSNVDTTGILSDD